MKYILLVSFCLFFLTIGISQETFNKRLNFDRPVPTLLTSIEVNDSCYYVSGITFDTVAPFRKGVLFAKMSIEGEVEWYNTLTDSFKVYNPSKNTLIATDDNGFVITGNYVDTIGEAIVLMRLDQYGDTLFLKKYFSPYYQDDDFIRLLDARTTQDSGFLLLININGDTTSYTDLYLIKTDSIGNVLWDRIYGGETMSESGRSIELVNDNIIIGAFSHNLNFATNNFIAQVYLIALDSVQEIEWEYHSPENELLNSPRDVIKTSDGGLLIASGKGVEIPDNPNYSHLEWHNYIFKLDANHEFEWGVEIRDSLRGWTNYLSKLIAPSDQSGYVAVGQIYEPNFVEIGYDLHGIITKISLEGDSLWTRYYHHVVSPFDQHDLYDVEETPDGGFIMVGQATDSHYTAEDPKQRAWILKVDQHGCLVPGCHLISDLTEPNNTPDIQVNIFPNPTSDYLNVYFRHPQIKGKAQFDLLDANGRSVLQFESRHGDITHVVDVGSFVAGIYFLRCLVGGETVVKEVVIAR